MPIINVCFKVRGDVIPYDHGYLIMSKLSRIIPTIHADESVGIHSIPGSVCGERMISLGRQSRLTIRIDSERIGELLPLAGKTIQLAGHSIGIGIPIVRPLIPAKRLYSRLVVIKGFTDAGAFLEAVKRQLKKMGIHEGIPELVRKQSAPKIENTDEKPFLRRTLNIHGREIVGFAVRVTKLTPAESLQLQEKGLGGRQRFGCGILIPDKKYDHETSVS